MIYVDNAATTKMSQAALAEMQTCFEATHPAYTLSVKRLPRHCGWPGRGLRPALALRRKKFILPPAAASLIIRPLYRLLQTVNAKAKSISSQQ